MKDKTRKFIQEAIINILILIGGIAWGHSINTEYVEQNCNDFILENYVDCDMPHCTDIVYTFNEYEPALLYNFSESTFAIPES